MSFEVREMAGLRVLVCAEGGPPLEGDGAATDLVGEAYVADAALVAIPLGRLGPGFLDLSTRQAGEFLQKLINYGRRVALVGDVSAAAAGSKALTDFVRESNRGRHVWFVDDLAALEAKLAASG